MTFRKLVLRRNLPPMHVARLPAGLLRRCICHHPIHLEPDGSFGPCRVPACECASPLMNARSLEKFRYKKALFLEWAKKHAPPANPAQNEYEAEARRLEVVK